MAHRHRGNKIKRKNIRRNERFQKTQNKIRCRWSQRGLNLKIQTKIETNIRFAKLFLIRQAKLTLFLKTKINYISPQNLK